MTKKLGVYFRRFPFCNQISILSCNRRVYNTDWQRYTITVYFRAVLEEKIDPKLKVRAFKAWTNVSCRCLVYNCPGQSCFTEVCCHYIVPQKNSYHFFFFVLASIHCCQWMPTAVARSMPPLLASDLNCFCSCPGELLGRQSSREQTAPQVIKCPVSILLYGKF